jgi:hypothetical protein
MLYSNCIFGDYLSDQVVAPAPETFDQAPGAGEVHASLFSVPYTK